MPATSETAATTLLDDAPAYGSFISGVAITFTTRLLMLAGVFGSGVIIARWLGAEGFGTFAVLNVTVALALQVGSAVLPSSNTYFIARDRQTLGPIWANAIVFGLVAGAILASGIMALAWVKPSLLGGVPITLLLIAVVSIPFQLLSLLGLNVLLAMDRIRQLNLFDSLAPAFALLNAIVVLIILRERLTLLILFNTAAAIVLSLWLSWYLGRLVKRQAARQAGRPSFQLWKAMLSYGVKFYIS